MNASDDRNISGFKRQLEATTQMCSVMSNDSRPNCLVLDEIDGAPVVSNIYIVVTLYMVNIISQGLQNYCVQKLNLTYSLEIYFLVIN